MWLSLVGAAACGGGGSERTRAGAACQYRAPHRVREIHAAERARRDSERRQAAAARVGESLVSRRAGQRGSRPHRLRAPLRAHDVPGLEARAARHAFQVPRERRRQRHERHHRLRPHELLRDAALESAGAGAVARVRSHGLSARQARCGGAHQPAGRRAERAAPERGEPAVRHGRGSRRARAVSGRASVPRQRHGLAPGHSGREARRCEEIFQAVLRAEQREPGDRRRFRQGADQGARRKVLRHVQEGRARCRRSR